MALFSKEKDDYISTWKTSDLKGLMWFPVLMVVFFYLKINLIYNDSALERKLALLLNGTFFILSSKALAILFNLDWIISLWSKPFILVTPFRVRVLGGLMIALSLILFLSGQ